MSSEEWNVTASRVSMRTSNPIRNIVDRLKPPANSEKKLIALSIGDPTVFGNLKTSETCVEAIVEAASSFESNGYPHSCGYASVREAIAKKFETATSPLHANDVIVTSGCSGALDIAIGALADEGDNILLPCPGFSLYRTLCDSKGIECRFYRLLPDRGWEVDLAHLRELVDDRTKAILINNPSNPCGSVFSREHLLEILQNAEDLHIPIISDEIYAYMVFSDVSFVPIASLTSSVPVLTVGGLAKQYLVPGWRLGWILIHDRHEIFAREVREGLLRLTTLILGANSITQAAVPKILSETPSSFYDEVNQILEDHARFSVEQLSNISGLSPVAPQGAMYIMVGIDIDRFSGFLDDVEFSQKLLAEENVVVLPGQCFNMKNYFRIVTCPPREALAEAYERISQFCSRYQNCE